MAIGSYLTDICEWFSKTCEDFPLWDRPPGLFPEMAICRYRAARIHDHGGKMGCCCRQDRLLQLSRRWVGDRGLRVRLRVGNGFVGWNVSWFVFFGLEFQNGFVW